MSIGSVSFKSYIPVTHYAKHPVTGEYCPVLKSENIRKCQGFVVRNLNGTAKNNKSTDFVNMYKSFDKDYAYLPVVHSVYDKESPVVYMVTGRDVDVVQQMAKTVGKAKHESISILGDTNSFEAKNASYQFFKNVKAFLRKSCKCVKNDNNENLSLRVYFNPKYNRNSKLTGFEFVNAEFVKENS